MKFTKLLTLAALLLLLPACNQHQCCGDRNSCDRNDQHCPHSTAAQTEILPVTGTWINLAWQDERNNYMNFIDEKRNTDPALWTDKMCELHAIGVDYIAFMQVANNGKAYYPSKIMKHHFPKGRKSPVEAIMDACDSLGMHVLLSCGWAENQLDDVGDSAIVRRQCEIMDELAELYGDRPSFYGWYLPIEDCLSPYLPDRSVAGINRLTARAHRISPGKRTMVAPWGIYGADLDNPKFAQNLSAIDVDIIAYQDEIGCVRDHLPMHRMKKNFRKLGKMHENLKLEYWVNIENFTWDRGTNNWFSTLIPAEFGRYLAQIVSASQSGAKRIVSFSMCGIYDAPHSAHPLGQPVESNLAYTNYQKWLAGDPHWKLLESVFAGTARNDAAGCPVYKTENWAEMQAAAGTEAVTGNGSAKCDRPQGKKGNGSPKCDKPQCKNGSAKCDKGGSKCDRPQRKNDKPKGEAGWYLPKLTDGVFGDEDTACNDWISFCNSFDVIVDLGEVRDIACVAPRFLHYSKDLITMPKTVTVSLSVDGQTFTDYCLEGPHAINDKHDCWTDISYFTAQTVAAEPAGETATATTTAANEAGESQALVAEQSLGRARYVRVSAPSSLWNRIFCDEIIVQFADD